MYPAAMNNSNVVVGGSYVWSAGTNSTLSGTVNGIDDAGHMVGTNGFGSPPLNLPAYWASPTATPSQLGHSFPWNGGPYGTDAFSLRMGGDGTIIGDIYEGLIYSFTMATFNTDGTCSYLWTPGGDPDPPGDGPYAFPASKARGHWAGNYQMRNQGPGSALISIDSWGAVMDSTQYASKTAWGVNDSGVLVGQDNSGHALIIAGTGSGTLGTGVAIALNNATVTSGTNVVAQPQIVGVDGSGNPTLWDYTNPDGSTATNYVAKNINQLLPPNSGWAVTATTTNSLASYPGITHPIIINNGGSIAATASYSGTDTAYVSGTNGALLIPAELAVDANRDGTIVMATDSANPANAGLPVDQTTQAKSFRYWVNNNEDQPSTWYGIAYPNTEPPVASSEDYLSNSIVSTGDLEDWTRLWIYTKGLNAAISAGTIKVGLKWKNVNGTTPGIKIVKATDSDGGTEYLSDTTGAAATAQAKSSGSPRPVLKDGNDNTTTNIVPTGNAADFVFPTSVWTSLTDSTPKTFFLFEGTSKGKGQLEIVFLKSDGTTKIGEGGNLWLDLKDIKEMYQREIAAGAGPNPTPSPEPYVYGSPGFQDSIATYLDSNNSFVAPPDETKQCIVFVHGWLTDWNGFTDYSERFFKRLWWQGYKGRFIGFTWPALTGLASYNSSEWNAWLYGKAFKNYVSGIEGNYTNFTVAAHSQGNIVVGSAIQQGLTIPNYIMLQAAEPTGLYTTNNTYNNYAPFITQEATYPTPDTAANLGYRGFITPEFGNVSHYYCFYNPQDFALATGSFLWSSVKANWEANQLGYKPDGDPEWSGLGHYTSYGTTLVSGASGTWDPDNIFHSVRQVTEAHESMSFIARARSKAVGADANSAAVFSNATDLHATYNFGNTLPDHSGQFLRDYHQVYPLYQQFKTIIAP
jgi:hypothetical protein